MNKEKLEEKVEEIPFSKLIQTGIPSNCLSFVLEQYQEKYGKQNVWIESDSFYIKTQLNMKAGG